MNADAVLSGHTNDASNNGLHPTPHQRASHGSCGGARVMPGVMPLYGESES